MSKHFHYCSWQIWQLLSSNAELQLHLMGVWIETDYLGSDSELSLLSPQCNLLLFDGAASNSGSARQSLKTIPANAAARAAFSPITNVPLHVARDSVLWLSTRKVKNAERWKIEKKKNKRNGCVLERWWGKWFQPQSSWYIHASPWLEFLFCSCSLTAKSSVPGYVCLLHLNHWLHIRWYHILYVTWMWICSCDVCACLMLTMS